MADKCVKELNLTGTRIGRFELGPKIQKKNTSLVECIEEYCGWSRDANLLLILKILSTPHGIKESEEFRNGRLLLHNEYNVLCLLQDVPGGIRQYGLHREMVSHQGKKYECLILALDYPVPFGHLSHNGNLVNLQQYVIHEKRLDERKAVTIFHNLVKIVNTMHKRNIVHRDLKLCNMLLCSQTLDVTIINFSLSKLLISHDELLRDQRGSLAYVSPDVLSGLPYNGKCSDMWAMGVLLYTMLYGQFPFYDGVPEELFKRISAADYTIPKDIPCSVEVQAVIEQLLELKSSKRMTVSALLQELQSIMSRWSNTMDEEIAVVPQKADDLPVVDFPATCPSSQNVALPVVFTVSISQSFQKLANLSPVSWTKATHTMLSETHSCKSTAGTKKSQAVISSAELTGHSHRCHEALLEPNTLKGIRLVVNDRQCRPVSQTGQNNPLNVCGPLSLATSDNNTRNSLEQYSHTCPSTPVLNMSASNLEYLFGSDQCSERLLNASNTSKTSSTM